MSFKNDYKYGIRKEHQLKNVLECAFKSELIKTTNYHPFDFHNVDHSLYIEVKSRKCPHNQYDTTIIPYSKYEYGNKLKKRNKNVMVYYVFNFTDKIMCIEHSHINFTAVRMFKRKARCDYVDRVQRYGYIDVSDLTPLDN